uniref:Uncharacterized protein n=1 Tax=Leersia perrieri TaxID=77586 RepID=A0A0D9W1X8_9ORYZ
MAARHQWMADEEPGFRGKMIRDMTTKCMAIIDSQQENHYRGFHIHSVRFEEEAFTNTTNKVDYMDHISRKFVDLEARIRHQAWIVPSARRPSSQQQNVHNTQQNSGQMPDQAETMAAPCPLNCNTVAVGPVATCVQPSHRSMQPQSPHQQQAKQLHPTKIAGYNPTFLDQQPQEQSVVGENLKLNHLLGQSASATGTQLRQLAEKQRQSQLMRMNKQYMRGSQQQNCTQRNQILGVQQANVAKMQIGHPGVQNNRQNVRKECQPMTPPQQRIGVAQQSSFVCQSPQTSGAIISPGEVDWREEIFQKITSLKEAYLSEVKEFDKMVRVPNLTKEQIRALPMEKARGYRRALVLKQLIKSMLDFMQIPESKMHKSFHGLFPRFLNNLEKLRRFKIETRNAETNTENQSQNCREQPQIVNLIANASPLTCDASRQQKQQEQLMDAKTSKMEQAIITRTPTAHQENNGYYLLGLSSPCFSPGDMQPLSATTLKECFTPSPLTKPRGAVQVASPHVTASSALVKSSIAKPGIVQVVSPCTSVKSRLSSPTGRSEVARVASPSTSDKSTLPSISNPRTVQAALPCPIAKPGTAQAALPCAPVKSTSQSPLARPGAVRVDSPRASVTLNLRSTVDMPQTAQAASPCASVNSMVSLDTDHQAEDQVPHGPEIVDSKNPISRLVQLVRSSSPEVLRSSVNAMRLAIWEADRIPEPPLPYQSRNGRMKRVFDNETSPLCNTDESDMTSECGEFGDESSVGTSKRRKTVVNANDALVNEIKAINSKLIDTVISIADENGTDGIISWNRGGTLIKLSYSAVSLAPNLKSLFAAPEMSIVMPVKLLVPADYPRSPPMFVDNDRDDEEMRKLSDISHAVVATFRQILCDLPEPRSIEVMAGAWDGCVRRAVVELAHRHGGGTFSSRCSQWESSKVQGHTMDK